MNQGGEIPPIFKTIKAIKMKALKFLYNIKGRKVWAYTEEHAHELIECP